MRAKTLACVRTLMADGGMLGLAVGRFDARLWSVHHDAALTENASFLPKFSPVYSYYLFSSHAYNSTTSRRFSPSTSLPLTTS